MTRSFQNHGILKKMGGGLTHANILNLQMCCIRAVCCFLWVRFTHFVFTIVVRIYALFVLKSTSAQCSRCQLGCSGSQNLPCSICRRIICSCSYCMEHPKFLLYELLEQIILHKQKPQYAPGSCYRSKLPSCSYYRSTFCSKWRN